MAKKPRLNLVQPGTDQALSPPASLGEVAAGLWQSIMHEYGIHDAPGLSMLREICFATDRAERCRQQIEIDGALIETKTGQLKDHPLLRHELANRAFAVRALARLGLDVEPLKPIGRPGHGLRGYRGV